MFYFQKFFYYYEEKFNTKFGYFNLLFMVIIEKIIKHLLSFYSLFYHLMMKLVGRGFFINLNKKFCFPSYILIFISNDTCNILQEKTQPGFFLSLPEDLFTSPWLQLFQIFWTKNMRCKYNFSFVYYLYFFFIHSSVLTSMSQLLGYAPTFVVFYNFVLIVIIKIHCNGIHWMSLLRCKN